MERGQSLIFRCCPKRGQNPASVLSDGGKCPKWLHIVLVLIFVIGIVDNAEARTGGPSERIGREIQHSTESE